LKTPELVQHFLGKPMERSGKEIVVNEAFRLAATNFEEVQQLEGIRLSFNKYCGVQQWKNGFFLWVNMGTKKSSSNNNPAAVVNEFLEQGRLVTWFGGSNMVEESPVIQSLLDKGKRAAVNKPELSHSSFGIVLWCRQYRVEAKQFGPYVCLGRLGYESHVKGSNPLAFVWRLLDYDDLMKSSIKREVFQGVINA
jgi:hypothetical protein